MSHLDLEESIYNMIKLRVIISDPYKKVMLDRAIRAKQMKLLSWRN